MPNKTPSLPILPAGGVTSRRNTVLRVSGSILEYFSHLVFLQYFSLKWKWVPDRKNSLGQGLQAPGSHHQHLPFHQGPIPKFVDRYFAKFSHFSSKDEKSQKLKTVLFGSGTSPRGPFRLPWAKCPSSDSAWNFRQFFSRFFSLFFENTNSYYTHSLIVSEVTAQSSDLWKRHRECRCSLSLARVLSRPG